MIVRYRGGACAGRHVGLVCSLPSKHERSYLWHSGLTRLKKKLRQQTIEMVETLTLVAHEDLENILVAAEPSLALGSTEQRRDE